MTDLAEQLADLALGVQMKKEAVDWAGTGIGAGVGALAGGGAGALHALLAANTDEDLSKRLKREALIGAGIGVLPGAGFGNWVGQGSADADKNTQQQGQQGGQTGSNTPAAPDHSKVVGLLQYLAGIPHTDIAPVDMATRTALGAATGAGIGKLRDWRQNANTLFTGPMGDRQVNPNFMQTAREDVSGVNQLVRDHFTWAGHDPLKVQEGLENLKGSLWSLFPRQALTKILRQNVNPEVVQGEHDRLAKAVTAAGTDGDKGKAAREALSQFERKNVHFRETPQPVRGGIEVSEAGAESPSAADHFNLNEQHAKIRDNIYNRSRATAAEAIRMATPEAKARINPATGMPLPATANRSYASRYGRAGAWGGLAMNVFDPNVRNFIWNLRNIMQPSPGGVPDDYRLDNHPAASP